MSQSYVVSRALDSIGRGAYYLARTTFMEQKE